MVAGDTVTLMLDPEGLTETIALAFFVLSAELVAVTVAVVVVDTLGAVNRPPSEILPAVVDQMTAVLLVPCTAAANCWVFPEATLVLVGEIVTMMLDPAELEIVICVFSLPTRPVESVAFTVK